MLLVELLLIGYFGFVVFHNFFFSAVSFTRTDGGYFKTPSTKWNKIAVLIPSYKEDGVIVHTAECARSHNYPSEFFDVFIIADSLLKETIDRLRKTNADILEVSFEKSTKVRALQFVLSKIEGYDIAVILDADNVMNDGFLEKINHAFNNGFHYVQGRRIAKNSDTPMAYLDSISESINNQIFRKGYNAVGLSSSLIGSGMSFPFAVLKHHIMAMDSVGGFDRELCLRLLEDKHKIYYIESAEVFDEKTRKTSDFSNQRRRWLSSQFVYLRKYFSKGIDALFKGNFVFFEAAVLSNLLLPRILTLGLLTILGILSLLLREYLVLGAMWTWSLLLVYMIAMLIAIPRKYLNRKMLSAMATLPSVFIIMFVNLFRLKGANKKFIHTPHSNAPLEPKKP
jgi:cellulose synthase/poly-beta-1,6-N-acetylglucosamine synthase-like glycosyltransferase